MSEDKDLVIKNQHGEDLDVQPRKVVLPKRREKEMEEELKSLAKAKKGKEIIDAIYWERPRKGEKLRGKIGGFSYVEYERKDKPGEKDKVLTAYLFVWDKERESVVTYIMSQTIAASKLFKAGQGVNVEIECTGTKGDLYLFEVHELD